ncbi:hypothetical protein B0H17DRAFT_1140710 [Mycena rosella]|uniref:Uncharacterized protein n=1 Tax=Mycena rosella TaxID=1033263 RepID=A0AAD7D1R5_MYCRO|nr:hypothetical protein B0H17DRAFT_1140710 [Mycena rosella]
MLQTQLEHFFDLLNGKWRLFGVVADVSVLHNFYPYSGTTPEQRMERRMVLSRVLQTVVEATSQWGTLEAIPLHSALHEIAVPRPAALSHSHGGCRHPGALGPSGGVCRNPLPSTHPTHSEFTHILKTSTLLEILELEGVGVVDDGEGGLQCWDNAGVHLHHHARARTEGRTVRFHAVPHAGCEAVRVLMLSRQSTILIWRAVKPNEVVKTPKSGLSYKLLARIGLSGSFY